LRTRHARDGIADMPKTIVAHLRKELEARGEYVALVNGGWFAIRPKTWIRRVESAKQQGRDGPNLILYRDESSDQRDHYVIPHALFRQRIEEVKPRPNVRDGERWDFTIKDDQLEHNPKSAEHRPLRAKPFHRVPLLVEEPTIIPTELELRVASLLKLTLERPSGQSQPRKIPTGSRDVSMIVLGGSGVIRPARSNNLPIIMFAATWMRAPPMLTRAWPSLLPLP
jgi:hypothetical protein